MIEPERNDEVGSSVRPVSVMQRAAGRCAPHRKPQRLTISVHKIDLLLADIQKQVEDLLQQMTNLRLVRTQLADYQSEHRGDEERAPDMHPHTALVNMWSDA